MLASRKLQLIKIILVALPLFFITAFFNAAFAMEQSQEVADQLEQPYFSKAEILDWAEKAVHSLYNYSYVDYQHKLKSAETLFTRLGWKSFRNHLKNSNEIDEMIVKKMKMTSVIKGEATIIAEGVKQEEHLFKSDVKRYFWQVKIPILIEYKMEQKSEKNNNQVDSHCMVVLLTIVRVASADQSVHQGIAISEINTQAMKN